MLNFLCLLTLIRVEMKEFNFYLNLIFNYSVYIVLYVNVTVLVIKFHNTLSWNP